MPLPYDIRKELIEQARQAIAPGAVDVTSGGGSASSSPALPGGYTDVNANGETTSEAFFDESDWDSETDLWA